MENEEKLKLAPGMKWQKMSKSAQGEYWYDIPKGSHINNKRLLRRYFVRQVPVIN